MLRWLFVVALVAVPACGGGGGGDGGDANAKTDETTIPEPDQNNDEEAPGIKPATYRGTVTTTHHLIDIVGTTGTSQVQTTTINVEVRVAEPLVEEGGDGKETNPFHLEVTHEGQAAGAVAGGISLASAVLQPNYPPPPVYTVNQYWSYDIDDEGDFEGEITRQLTNDPNNMVGTLELGGPFSIGPSPQWSPCVGTMSKATTIEGHVDENEIDFTIRGTAGGYLVGPTCMTEFEFEAHVAAKR